MTGKSTYGLTPKQLDQLLALGSGDPEREQAASPDDHSKGHPRTHSSSSAEIPRPQIPGYEILDKLGQAGQGQVWRALQLSTHRQVALKLPLAGSIHAEKGLLRFEREVELAAGLTHPNIARIHDSGLHQGLYFYAMDLIQGKHLDDYARSHHLSTRSILELMKTVCVAVQHAHQNGVIHRDLKPSNILVTDDGQPVIVDFGLARSLGPQGGAEAVSLAGEVTGTPAYMSPEQAAGRADQLDTRTDVYGLGILLFVLLTGQTPHDMSGSHYEVMRRIAEEPVRNPHKVCPGIDLELQWLMLKALDQDPDRRYTSAGALAEDIDRYLNELPLLAAPPSKVYEFRRFVRRHRSWVTAAVTLIVVLTGGVVVSTYFALGQARARSEAQAVSDFLQQDLLGGLVKASWDGERIHDVLRDAASKVGDRFANQPLVEAQICDSLGNLYSAAGEYKLALEQRLRANQIHLEKSGKYYRLSSLALSYNRMGQYGEAESLYLKNFKRAGRLDAQGSPVPHNKYPFTCCNLAGIYIVQGRYKEAEQLLKKALAAAQGWEPDDEWRLYYSGYLARAFMQQGQYKEAEQLYDTILKKMCRIPGEDDNRTIQVKADSAVLRLNQRRYDEAGEMLEEVLAIRKHRWGSGHPHTLLCMNHLAILRTRQERYDDANDLFIEVLQERQRRLGEDHPATLKTLHGLGVLRRNQHHYKQAEDLLREALEVRKTKLGPNHPACFESMHELAVLQVKQGRHQQAADLLVEVAEGQLDKLSPNHPRTQESLNLLIDLYKTLGQPEEAEKWRAKLPADGTPNGQS